MVSTKSELSQIKMKHEWLVQKNIHYIVQKNTERHEFHLTQMNKVNLKFYGLENVLKAFYKRQSFNLVHLIYQGENAASVEKGRVLRKRRNNSRQTSYHSIVLRCYMECGRFEFRFLRYFEYFCGFTNP